MFGKVQLQVFRSERERLKFLRTLLCMYMYIEAKHFCFTNQARTMQQHTTIVICMYVTYSKTLVCFAKSSRHLVTKHSVSGSYFIVIIDSGT